LEDRVGVEIGVDAGIGVRVEFEVEDEVRAGARVNAEVGVLKWESESKLGLELKLFCAYIIRAQLSASN